MSLADSITIATELLLTALVAFVHEGCHKNVICSLGALQQGKTGNPWRCKDE
jgi:hypothetical protein